MRLGLLSLKMSKQKIINILSNERDSIAIAERSIKKTNLEVNKISNEQVELYSKIVGLL